MTKKDIFNHIINFITVILGIIIAFWINSAYENSRTNASNEKYYEGIKYEINNNLKELEDKLKYHKALVKKLKTKPLEARLLINSPFIQDYAWQISKNSSLSESLNYDLYKRLVEAYHVLEVLNQHSQHVGQLMSEVNVMSHLHLAGLDDKTINNSDYTKRQKQGWIPVFQDMIYYEEALIFLYQEVLKKM